MRVLALNAGSASVKCAVFENGDAVFERTLENAGDIERLLTHVPGILKDEGYDRFDAVGHRIAHGGVSFREACLIDEAVVRAIEACSPLAPLHNPPNLAGVRMAQKEWPDAAQIAVFDTAFHQTMPERAVIYAVPEEWRDQGVRHYGFHGASHHYVMLRAAESLQTSPETLRIISCHLGGGVSICAIDRGRSIENSMGMTALGGPVMGTRSGDIDPGLYAFLYRTSGLNPNEVERRLYRDSGLKSLAGTGDMREIEKKAAQGDEGAILALDVFSCSVRRYIGAYAALMNGVDILVFTGGIGEHSAGIRKRVCADLEFMGIHFDDEKNAAVKLSGYEAPQIQKETSRVKIIVTKTREQWMIVREAERILKMPGPAVKKEARA